MVGIRYSSKLVFLDESSVNTGMTRLYGRGFEGEKVVDYTPDVRFQRTSILSSINLNGDYVPMIFSGSLDGELFKKYFEEDGLPNDVICGLAVDNNNKIWLSTIKGLSQFDPIEKSFRNFDKSDGLQANLFTQGVYLKSSKGDIYFGGRNGLNVFNPEQIQLNDFDSPIVITSVKVFPGIITFALFIALSIEQLLTASLYPSIATKLIFPSTISKSSPINIGLV